MIHVYVMTTVTETHH